MLAVCDIVKITDYGVFLGQQVQNVWFYRCDAIPDPYTDETVDEAFCHAFNAQVRIFELPLQSTAMGHTLTRMDNVTNGIDFAEIAAPVNGLVDGDQGASFDAINFILRRTTGVTRNGSKRLGGLPESGLSGNSWLILGTPLTNFQNAAAAQLTDGGTPTPSPFATPVIVGRKVVGTGPHGPVYGLDLTKINPIASVALTAVSTQRSRKVGHGS